VHGSDAAANTQHNGDDGGTDGYLLTFFTWDSISSLGVALDGHHITVPIGCSSNAEQCRFSSAPVQRRIVNSQFTQQHSTPNPTTHRNREG
jgi:hypothetical protein